MSRIQAEQYSEWELLEAAIQSADLAQIEAILAAAPPVEIARMISIIDKTEYLSYSEDLLVKEVLDDLRAQGEAYSDYDIQYAYVVSNEGRLIGVLRLRDLLMAPPAARPSVRL